MDQFAIKFFFKRKEFEEEVALYAESALCVTLPHMYQACANLDGAYKSERCGQSPAEEARRRR